MVVSYIITTWAIYQWGYIKTRKCGNITALGNSQTKRGPLKFPQAFFLIIPGSSTPFLITFTPGYCKSCQHFPSPRKSHILNPCMVFFIIIIKSGMCSYTTLYTLFFKVGLSSSKQNSFYLPQWKPIKNDEKCFLFHLKSSFRS